MMVRFLLCDTYPMMIKYFENKTVFLATDHLKIKNLWNKFHPIGIYYYRF